MPTPQQADPFASIAQPIQSQGADPFAAIAQPVDAATPPPQSGFFGSFANSSGLAMLGHAAMHPLDTAATVLDAGRRVLAPNQPANMSDNPSPIISGIGHAIDSSKSAFSQGVQDFKTQGLSQQTRRDFVNAIPLVGPSMQQAQAQSDAGNNAGAVGTMLGLGAGLAAPKLLPETLPNPGEVLTHPIDTLTAPMRSGLDEPMTGTTLTPRQRYQSAQNLGVQLDAADATNNGALKMAKAVNQHSLLGSGIYDARKAQNLSAVQGSLDNLQSSMFNADRESGGAAIQNALRNDQQGLRNAADAGFQTLTDQTSGQPMAGSPAVGQKAQSLLNTITPLAEKYPSLAPAKTMSVLSDLSNVGAAPKPAPRSFLDTPGSEFAVPAKSAPPNLDTFSDLQRLRSATHDLTTTNPDLVKSQAIAPLQQMTSSLDDAMTNAANGLTPQQTQMFREANANWRDMKATYDDNGNPLYHAVRTNTPSTLYSGNGLGPRTPEAVRDLLARLGGDDAPAVGALRRGVVESALKTTNDGSPNLRTFGTQWNRIPADYRAELYTLPQNQTLQDITNTSNLLGQDLNPSGTAKLGQKAVEAAQLVASPFHPLGAVEPLAQYPLARLLNSPGFTDYLMQPRSVGARAPISNPVRLLPVPLQQGAPFVPAFGNSSAQQPTTPQPNTSSLDIPRLLRTLPQAAPTLARLMVPAQRTPNALGLSDAALGALYPGWAA